MSRSVLIVLNLVFFAAFVAGQEETVCRGQDVKLTDVEKEQVNSCLRDNKIDSIWKIPMERIGCFGVCILERKSMLTDDGKINHEKALAYIDAHMPDPETKKLLIDAADKCIKEHGDKIKVDNDPLCDTFMGVGMCVHDAFLEICAPTPP